MNTAANGRALRLAELSAADDAVTSLRNEMKFDFFGVDIRKLDTILQVNNRRVVFAAPESIVSSVYFDDCRLTSLRESLDGVASRQKLRLRWYDSDLPERLAFFEVKRRHNRLIGKDRYPVASQQPFGRMRYRELIPELLCLLPDTHCALLSARQQPVVLVRYRRLHYRARDPRLAVRITLDYRITAFDQAGARAPAPRFGMPLHDRAVLEVKSTGCTEKEILQLLHPLSPRLSRFSKYGLCCSRMGLAAGIDEAFM